MNIIICGGRYLDRSDAFNWLENNLFSELHLASGCYSVVIKNIIHGGCRGADEGAGDWAMSENIPVSVVLADWKKHGKSAGPIRNRKMIEDHKPDFVVALPGGKGTANMVRLAEEYGVPVIMSGEW